MTDNCPASKINNKTLLENCKDKKLYKRLSLKIHPDKNTGCVQKATEKFKMCKMINDGVYRQTPKPKKSNFNSSNNYNKQQQEKRQQERRQQERRQQERRQQERRQQEERERRQREEQERRQREDDEIQRRQRERERNQQSFKYVLDKFNIFIQDINTNVRQNIYEYNKQQEDFDQQLENNQVQIDSINLEKSQLNWYNVYRKISSLSGLDKLDSEEKQVITDMISKSQSLIEVQTNTIKELEELNNILLSSSTNYIDKIKNIYETDQSNKSGKLKDMITNLTSQYNKTNQELKNCTDKLSVCNTNSFKIHQKHIEDINDINNTHKKEIDEIEQKCKSSLDKQQKTIEIECNNYVNEKQQEIKNDIQNQYNSEITKRETDIRNQYNSELSKRETDIRNKYNSELARRVNNIKNRQQPMDYSE